MNSPRTLRSPRQNNTKEPKRPVVYLYKIDFPDNPSKRVRLPKDIPELLKIATDVLELNRPAKQVLDDKSNTITDISKIADQTKLYISCANPTVDVEDEPLYKSRLPKNYSSMGGIKLPTVKQPAPKPKREDAVQHQAIAASPYTVKENLRDSLLALYSSLTPEHKAQLPCSEALQKLQVDTQQFLVEDSLLAQFIGPSSVINNTPLGQQATSIMMNKLKGLRPEDCRFAITGPTQSGKSTLLNIIVSLFYQKLQLSHETQNYLLFPLNWLLHQIYLDDIQKIYGTFISTALNSLRSSHMEYIPIMNSLHQWFISLVTIPAFPPLPPSVLHFTGFPTQTVIQLGRNLHDKWNSRSGFKDFLTSLAHFPNQFAHAFGYKSAVYIFDHFESCGFRISPSERFSESEHDVLLSQLLCEAMDSCPFFVSSQDDGEFFVAFTIQEFNQISTERLITKKDDKEIKEILIAKPQMSLSIDMCRGCPAYCAMYLHLCDLITEANERAAVKSQFSRLRSVVDMSRQEMVKQELFRLCLLLATADSENLFNENAMNDLMNMSEINVQVR